MIQSQFARTHGPQGTALRAALASDGGSSSMSPSGATTGLPPDRAKLIDVTEADTLWEATKSLAGASHGDRGGTLPAQRARAGTLDVRADV